MSKHRSFKPPDPHVFSFRLPDDILDWLDKHIPEVAENRHQALRGFVIETIKKNPDYVPDASDPYVRMRSDMEEWMEEQAERTREELRDFVRKMLQDSGTFERIATFREAGEGAEGKALTDDVIDNILAGVT